MTVNQALEQADLLRPNDIPRGLKCFWLSRLDGQLRCEFHLPPEQTPAFPGDPVCPGQLPDSEGACASSGDCPAPAPCGRVLLVPAPFDELYSYYLCMRIDLEQGEIVRYNNSARLFDVVYRRFAHAMSRHLPAGEAAALRF